MEFGTVFYFNNISFIGGIESWYYYISKLCKDYDVTLLYEAGNDAQLNRLSANIRCVKWDRHTRIKCKKLFINFAYAILDYCDCDDVTFVVHGDYNAMIKFGHTKAQHLITLANNPRVTRILCCSKAAQTAFKDITGRDAELCYNPVELDEPKRIIRLCSAQRMTQEKGKGRIKELIKALDHYCMATGMEYEWDFYTNDPHEIQHERIHYKKPRVDVNRYFGSYDYFIALSDAEGYCYSVVEALCRGTPCVVTPVPVFKELGLTERNSITLEYSCSNVADVVQQMFSKKLKFKYTPKKSTILDYIPKAESSYINDHKRVKCIALYKDMKLDRVMRPGDTFTVDNARAAYLESLGLVIEEG